MSEQRPYATASSGVSDSRSTPTINTSGARLLLHDAADALTRSGGPVLSLSTPGLEEETDEFGDQIARLLALADPKTDRP